MIYAKYALRCYKHTRDLAGKTNRGSFVAYVVIFSLYFPVFLLMPSYRKQVREDMGVPTRK